MSAPLTPAQRVAMLNDTFRKAPGCRPVPGMMVLTQGINGLPLYLQMAAIAAVASFQDFTPDNDPCGEHDFGMFEIEGQRLFWKIDVDADSDCQWGSEHPADPARSYRVLTIMLAAEY